MNVSSIVIVDAKKVNASPRNFFKEGRVPGVAENASNIANRTVTDTLDNGDDPITLGVKLNNPYTIFNMRRAYHDLYGTYPNLTANHLYVRFKPTDVEQLKILVEDSTLELQDYPMDYAVEEDGDFYQDPALGPEDIGWLYTVVPPNYTPPAGIPYQIIESLYLPETENDLWESMAESIAAGATYITVLEDENRHIARTDEEADTLVIANRSPIPCNVNPCETGCPETWLPDGYCVVGTGGGGSGGGGNARIPKGTVRVQDIIRCINPSNITNVPVMRARIVCKRWFKIWRGYTDNQGMFVSGKTFKNKCKVIVKSRNEFAKVSKMRGIRIWQMFFPVKRKLGVFDAGDMANIDYLFTKPTDANAHNKDLPVWVAITVHNSVLEFRNYATADNIGLPPSNLQIIVSNWGFQRGAGSTPMWAKCSPLYSELSNVGDYLKFFVSFATFSPALQVLKTQMDMVIGYAASNGDYDCRLNSPQLKELAFHELGHAAHFAQAGCDYWTTYRVRIANEIITTFNGPTAPYGSGNETNAGVVAVGEMWGNFCGYYYTDKRYGNGGGGFGYTEANGDFVARLQFVYGNVPGGLNAYLNAIEDFRPNANNDFQRWIPKGLCYDLIDGAVEPSATMVIDNVDSYSPANCFFALQPDVRSITQYRDRLLVQNSNRQAAQVITLFSSYNY